MHIFYHESKNHTTVANTPTSVVVFATKLRPMYNSGKGRSWRIARQALVATSGRAGLAGGFPQSPFLKPYSEGKQHGNKNENDKN